MTGDKAEVGTDLFSPPDPGGTACKQPWSSSLPPREKREREKGTEKQQKREMIKRSRGQVEETGEKWRQKGGKMIQKLKGS